MATAHVEDDLVIEDDDLVNPYYIVQSEDLNELQEMVNEKIIEEKYYVYHGIQFIKNKEEPAAGADADGADGAAAGATPAGADGAAAGATPAGAAGATPADGAAAGADGADAAKTTVSKVQPKGMYIQVLVKLPKEFEKKVWKVIQESTVTVPTHDDRILALASDAIPLVLKALESSEEKTA